MKTSPIKSTLVMLLLCVSFLMIFIHVSRSHTSNADNGDDTTTEDIVADSTKSSASSKEVELQLFFSTPAKSLHIKDANNAVVYSTTDFDGDNEHYISLQLTPNSSNVAELSIHLEWKEAGEQNFLEIECFSPAQKITLRSAGDITEDLQLNFDKKDD